jgi:hypothetical protein
MLISSIDDMARMILILSDIVMASGAAGTWRVIAI